MQDELAGFDAAFAAENVRARKAVRDFVQAVRVGDANLMYSCWDDLLDMGSWRGGGWRNAMRRVARLAAVPDTTREAFTVLWHDRADGIRSGCADDLTLASGLRNLLLPYTGRSAVQLYRGECGSDRRRRTYGLCWTPNLSIAHHHAKNRVHSVGGAVVIGALVPAAAIICGPVVQNSAEEEHVVDRRGLKGVKIRVLHRYAHAPVPCITVR